MELTPERLQSIAVDCVTQYMNKQASLSEAIAKEAQCLELNSDQTKRVIEAANTIAYLRQLEKAADRTFEFPVADYSEVMGKMCIPELQKAASEEKKEDEKKEDKEEKSEKSERTFPWSKKEDKDSKEDKDEDKDEDKKKSEEQEKVAMLTREFFRAKSNLEKIACDKVGLHLKLSSAASILHKDSLGLEKLAEIVEEEHFSPTLALCGIEKRAAESRVFTDKELDPAREVYSLYKEAKALIDTETELKSFVKRAESFFFNKQALFSAPGGVARISGTITKNTSQLTKATVNKAKSIPLVATKAPVIKSAGLLTGLVHGAAKLTGGAIRGVVKPIANKVGTSLGTSAKGLGEGLLNLGSPVPKSGFAGGAFNAGFRKNVKVNSLGKITSGEADIKAAVKHFDTVQKTKGLEAAKSQFVTPRGTKTTPNWLLHRDGANKAFTGLAAASVAGEATHSYSAKNELLPPKY